MIVVTIREAIEIRAAIVRLPKLPIKVAFELGRLGDEIRFAIKKFDASHVGKMVSHEELEQLQEEEVSLPFEKVKLADIAANGGEIEPAVIGALAPIILNGER